MSSYNKLRHETDMGVLTGRLAEVASAAIDLVASPTAVAFMPGASVLTLSEPLPTADGVYSALPIRFTRTALRQQAERFDIPLRYVDTLTAENKELLSTNFNARAVDCNSPTLYRLLATTNEAGERYWQCRATLSNGYQAIDNLDVLTAVVRGAAHANINLGDCQVEGDWTDDRFRLRIAVPQIAIHAHDLLDGYRSPFSMDPNQPVHAPAAPGEVGNVIWAGLEISNSETGGGAATVTPRAVVLICRNGLTRKTEAVRSVHLGGRLDEGPVKWSADTKRKALELIEAKMADAVSRFCSEDYLNDLANEMRAAKGLQVTDVSNAMVVVQQRLGFTEDEVREALNCFVKSGDTSVLGLGQAVTAMAQTVEDGDRQTEIEQAFWEIVNQPHLFAGATA